MDTWPEAAALRAFLTRVARRRRWLAAVGGAAAGLAAALVAALALWAWRGVADDALRAAAVALAAAGAASGAALALLRLRHAAPVASVVERGGTGSRNVVFTAAELLESPGRVTPYVGRAVCAEAASFVGGLEPARLLSARRSAFAAGASLAAWVLALLLMAGRPAALPAVVPFLPESDRPIAVEIEVTPPAYTGEPVRSLRDPERVEAVAGSRLAITVRAAADGVALETVAGRHELDAHGGSFVGVVGADADGFLAIETRRRGGAAGERRLIGLTVTPDHAPRVRIASPGRDLMLAAGDTVVTVEVEAEDDFGLASLRLRYTRVSGFGEQFTFLEGEVPLEVARVDARSWRGRARWPLAPLELAPGDMVVYRAVARDRRPGAAEGESDTWMVEILSGAAAAVGGFAGDEELDRYALSQQMVVVLTERLMARRSALSAAEFAAEARILAAAQRRVRAEFVFMLGGELEDEDHAEDGIMELHEEAHARADADVVEGRMANEGRIELARAIRAMSQAVTLLTDVEMADALRAEQTALVHLQRAFARSRYILRALTERERLDLSRRLTGTLAAAARDVRPRAEPELEPGVAALRAALAEAATLAAAPSPGEAVAARAAASAQAVLRVDPTSAALRDVAAALLEGSDAAGGGRAAEARVQFERAVSALTAAVRAELAASPGARPPPGVDRLDGALADALRGGGVR